MVLPASFPVVLVLGDFECDVTCQACRETFRSVPSLLRSLGKRELASEGGFGACYGRVKHNWKIVFFFVLSTESRKLSYDLNDSTADVSSGSCSSGRIRSRENLFTMLLINLNNSVNLNELDGFYYRRTWFVENKQQWKIWLCVSKKLYPHSKEPFCSFWDFLQKVFSIYEIYCLQV